jgi:glycolate oxidase iron-sulfur subunit
MQTSIHPDLASLPLVKEANDILRSCVHCGFCTAVCPTYQLLGDELDGPRGRIYLIKNLLEDNAIDDKSLVHLDRCLTCRSCETACPSGVAYGRLIDIGRSLVANVANKVHRPRLSLFISFLIRFIVPRKYLFRPLLAIGQFFRPVLPGLIARHIPLRQKKFAAADISHFSPRSKVLVLQGCVQSAATPNVNVALERVLATKGIAVLTLADEGCCGALEFHLSAHEDGLQRMRDLIDRLLPVLDDVDHIISSASGCGVTIKEYPLYLAEDPEYAAKAKLLVAKVVDACEVLKTLDFDCHPIRVAVHTPCSLQHGQSINGDIEQVLVAAGMTIVANKDAHLCCGSAGTYSILQPKLSAQLLTRKLSALQENSPEVIVTANIGCHLHLQTEAGVPVLHWLELIHQQLKS